ncbi:MAG TPA: indolepyruvate ferredoxin oxidoreductase subunit alpha [Eubacteriales bacterium]|nr:indolepyruvate ferredoxin oxidoreductase subunit alpha [Eubacteriales bacterium]
MRKKVLMTGNEAIARGVWEAGVTFASAYPGTPSTEILENVSKYPEICSEWSVNEKVALEVAIGAAVGGARAFCSMKHVGMNVAADPLNTVSYSGTNAGLLIVTADEPGQHSSQNEQDNRNYAKLAKMPMFCPSDSQECLDMVKLAYSLFDKIGEPVLLRMTTRVCHSKSVVELGEREEKPFVPYVKNAKKYVCVPANARIARAELENRLDALKEFSNNTEVNRIEDNGQTVGVIADGMCYNYAKETFGDTVNYLKIGMVNPLPSKKISQFCEKLTKVYIIEENDEYIEEAVRALGFGKITYGKYAPNGERFFPAYGELTDDVIEKTVYAKKINTVDADASKIVARPPALCAGCPHRGFFYEIGKRKNVVVSGDIGCYTLGFAPPYNAMDFNNCMGASISSGAGMQKVFNKANNGLRVVSVIGDSTFFHSGMTGLLDVVYNKANNITVILDNRITAMTGHQENPGTGYTISGEVTEAVDIEKIVVALGIKNIKTIDPQNLKQVNETLDWALAMDEASVIVMRYPCVLKKLSMRDHEQYPEAYKTKYEIDSAKCVGCKLCLKSGCPALHLNNGKAEIDKTMCVGCGICYQICKIGAIKQRGAK